MTNEQLAEFIQQGGNDELLPLLWDKTHILIYKKCSQYWCFYSEKLERFGYSLDDLRQEGYNALVFAVGQYKSEKGYKFTTYLNYALKHVIRCLLSGGADVLNQTGTMSIEQPLIDNSEGGTLLVGNVVPDERAAAVYEDIDRLDEFNVLYEAVDSLRPDLRDVIREHYFDGLTLKQIGERHRYSIEWARQKLRGALKALRSGKLGAKLRSVYGAAYGVRHKGLAAFKSSRTSEIEDYIFRHWREFSQSQ